MPPADPEEGMRDPSAAPVSFAARASVGSRFLAFCIDLLVVHILVAVVGLAATALTGGKVRIANAVVNIVDCAVSQEPPGLAAVHGLGTSDGFRCTRAIPGFVHDRTLVLREKAKAGEDDDDRRSVSIPVDDKGHPTSAFYVDRLVPLVLAAYLLLLEWRLGATPGKHVVGLRVQTPAGGSIGIMQAAKRLVRLIALMTAAMAPDVPALTGAYHRVGLSIPSSFDLPDFGSLTIVLQLIAWAFIISFIVMTRRRRQPLHDFWAGIEVVHQPAPARRPSVPRAH